MKKPLPAPIESLFQRYPALSGFSVRGSEEVPDSCSRSGEGSELFVADVGVSPMLDSELYGEIFHDIAATLSELLAERPECEQEPARAHLRAQPALNAQERNFPASGFGCSAIRYSPIGVFATRR